MNSSEVLLLGLKDRVAAVSRLDGHIFWSTGLSGTMSAGFVSVTTDGDCVFAYAGGRLHCLDMTSGQILWTNELEGFGYGLASLAVPGSSSTTAAAAAQLAMTQAAGGCG